MPHKLTIAVCCDDRACRHDASLLAARLALPLIELADDRFDYLLVYTAQRLQLQRTGRAAPGPVYADFVHGPLGYRRAHEPGRRQALIKAIGGPGPTAPSVIDTTAGLGRDAFILALAGCRVIAVERAPVVHALLANGLSRASRDPTLAAVCERLSIEHADAVCYLESLASDDKPDVIYLDPMYPHRRGSARNKKEMRVLRELVGDDDDAPALLTAALATATRRVVVKRPRWASPLAGPTPTVQTQGTTTRYDIYVRGLRHDVS